MITNVTVGHEAELSVALQETIKSELVLVISAEGQTPAETARILVVASEARLHRILEDLRDQINAILAQESK
jgi:hypothetical protein